MTQAVAYRETQDGQQSESSGLIIHRGPLSASLVRAVGSPATAQPVYPRDGQGSGSSMEMVHVPKGYSQIQSYDRDTQTWLPLYLNGSVLGLNTQTGQPVTMPQGSAQSAPVVAKYIGNWTIPSAGVWTETPVGQWATVTAGSPVRVEASGTITCSSPGALVYVGMGMDGGIVHDSMFVVQPAATAGGSTNTLAGFHVTGYFTSQIVATGAHRFAVFLYTNASPNQAGLWAGGYGYIWITEQRA